MSKKSVLIIDDEKDFCFFVKNNLEQTGEYEVTCVTDPDQGIKIVKHQPPDIILLDILMPKKDGFSVLDEIKKNDKTMSIPVIMLSAVGEDTAKIKAAQGYCQDYITKPVSFDVLKAKLDSLLN